MHLEHFGLRRDPFASGVDPRDFHPTRHHTEALEFLVGAVRDSRPLAILEGGPGTGKTMLQRVLAAELPPPYRCLSVDAADSVGLSVALARTLAVDSGTEDDAYCGEAVGVWLASRLREGERVVVAVDRAEEMSSEWISEVTELAGARPAPVRFVLAVDAESGLDDGGLPSTAVRHRLAGIERAGLAGYLKARLMNAGARDPGLFSDAAVAVLWELTDGVPARVHALAARSLLLAFGDREDRVDHELVLRAAEQIAAGKKPPRPRPVVRPLRARRQESEELEGLARRQRSVAAAGGGRSPSSPPPEPMASPPGDAEPERSIPAVPSDGPDEDPGVAGERAAPKRTYRVSADPQTEIDSLGIAEDEIRRRDRSARSPHPADRPRPRRSAASSTDDPFRDVEPVDPPFGPELLPVLSDPHGMAAEWFRVLRLRVEDWLDAVGGPPRTLLITSAHSAAGKTFVASNLALLCANQPGIRTLLVDGDLRKPRFEALFGVPRRPGFADVLARRASVEDCVRLVADTGLSVLPAGRPGNPRDLMSPERLEPAFDAMKELADLVIVDSPPMEPMVDARSMGTVVDGVAMVVRADRTRAPSLERSLQALSSARFVGAVITGVHGSEAERTYDGYRRSRG